MTIPTLLHRCIPEHVPPTFEDYWARWQGLHPGWGSISWQDPIDPDLFPVSSHAWPHVRAGAALAGLVRLEALATWGGIFLDWDVRPAKPLDDLLDAPGGLWAAWEDAEHVPDAVFGCEAGHPIVQEMLAEAVAMTVAGEGIWECSVGLFTRYLPLAERRGLATLLPVESFYPVSYLIEREHPGACHAHEPGPNTYGVHEYAWSWKGEG